MDDRHFDALTRALTSGDSRRRILTRLAALPALGGLLGILDADETEAGGGRRKRRKKRHKHGKGRRRKNKRKKCRAQPIAQTCSGTCGQVLNNCQKTVDCGPCDCGSCPICQTCDTITGQCIPATAGQACGDGLICVDGQCVCNSTSCPTGCCEANVCHVDDAAACGSAGGTCAPCDGLACVNGQCVCNGTSCPTGCCEANVCYVDDVTACGTAGGTCTPCVSDEVCEAGACCTPDGSTAPVGAPCCAGLTKCVTGVCQEDCCAGITCTVPGEECSGGVCAPPPTCNQFQTACNTGSQCCSGTCDASGCLCSRTDEACYVTRDCCQNPVRQRCVGFVCEPITN